MYFWGVCYKNPQIVREKQPVSSTFRETPRVTVDYNVVQIVDLKTTWCVKNLN